FCKTVTTFISHLVVIGGGYCQRCSGSTVFLLEFINQVINIGISFFSQNRVSPHTSIFCHHFHLQYLIEIQFTFVILNLLSIHFYLSATRNLKLCKHSIQGGTRGKGYVVFISIFVNQVRLTVYFGELNFNQFIFGRKYFIAFSFGTRSDK